MDIGSMNEIQMSYIHHVVTIALTYKHQLVAALAICKSSPLASMGQ